MVQRDMSTDKLWYKIELVCIQEYQDRICFLRQDILNLSETPFIQHK